MYTYAYVLMYLRVHTSVDDIGDMNQKIDILLDFFVQRMGTIITHGDLWPLSLHLLQLLAYMATIFLAFQVWEAF